MKEAVEPQTNDLRLPALEDAPASIFGDVSDERLGAGSPEDSGHTLSIDDPPALATPHPVLAQRGDLLLAHYLLGHNIGGNLSGRVRRVLYYRLSCTGHQEVWEYTFITPLANTHPFSQ